MKKIEIKVFDEAKDMRPSYEEKRSAEMTEKEFEDMVAELKLFIKVK